MEAAVVAEAQAGAPPPSQNGASAASPNRVRPTLPPSFFKFPVRARLKAVQQYISSFQYKQGPQTSFNSCKARPLARIMDTAKMMIYNPQPIKCVEAVFLALYLTAGIVEVDRIPLSFKSELHGKVYQHIVLLVKYNGRFGAFGISRQGDLMNKDLEFESISSIIEDYTKAYGQSHHKVLRIRVGLPVEHNVESFNFICWRYLSLDPSLSDWDQCSEELQKHVGQAKRLWERWLLDGQRENKKADMFPKENSLKPANDNSGKKKIWGQREPELSYKMVKRRQAPADEQGSSSVIMKRRQALREIRALKNESNHRSCKLSEHFLSSPTKKPPRELLARQCLGCQSTLHAVPPPLAHSAKSCEKRALKCFSLELSSGLCSRLAMHVDKRKAKFSAHQPKKGKKRCPIDRLVRQTHLLGLPLKVAASK